MPLALAFAGAAASAGPALAAPPTRGTVVEGHSVPGVALGATRAQAYRAWGKPSFCEGSRAELCTWEMRHGSPDLTFAGAHGGSATGGAGDVVSESSWILIPGWKTTAGVTTALAEKRPESVPPRYPHATVLRYGDGHLYQVRDSSLGIEIEWVPASYSSGFIVFVFVFPPGH